MYVVVILVESKTVLAIPAAYVQKLDVVAMMNSGLKAWKKHLIFFSPENHKPDFHVRIRKDFDENVNALYWANILKVCYTKEEADLKVATRRQILPVNYFNRHNRLDEDAFFSDLEQDIREDPAWRVREFGLSDWDDSDDSDNPDSDSDGLNEISDDDSNRTESEANTDMDSSTSEMETNDEAEPNSQVNGNVPPNDSLTTNPPKSQTNSSNVQSIGAQQLSPAFDNGNNVTTNTSGYESTSGSTDDGSSFQGTDNALISNNIIVSSAQSEQRVVPERFTSAKGQTASAPPNKKIVLQRNNDEATIRTIVEYGVAVGQKYATESILFFNEPSTSRLAVPADTHEQQSHGQNGESDVNIRRKLKDTRGSNTNSCSDDEIEFVSCDPACGAVSMPKPISVKNEDVLSGSEKFKSHDNHDRFYTRSEIVLHAPVVETLSLWNSTDPWNTEANDFIFIQFLLIDVFGMNILATKQLNDKKLRFVEEIFAHRVKQCGRRLASFKGHVDTVTEQFYDKQKDD